MTKTQEIENIPNYEEYIRQKAKGDSFWEIQN